MRKKDLKNFRLYQQDVRRSAILFKQYEREREMDRKNGKENARETDARTTQYNKAKDLSNKQSTNSSIQIDESKTKDSSKQENVHRGDQTYSSNVSYKINKGIHIGGNGNIGHINIGGDGYFHYKDKRISAKNFQAWRELKRNSRMSSMTIQEALEAYLKEAEDFKSFMSSPTNEGKDQESLWKEFQDKLNREYEQAKAEQKAEDRKKEELNTGKKQEQKRRKDKFGYFIDKSPEEEQRDKKDKGEKIVINGKEYTGPVNIKGKGIEISGIVGGTEINIGKQYSGIAIEEDDLEK